jgi:hypothetical protein
MPLLGLSKSHTHNVRWRSVALPTEHGGWSFISEPILLGLLIAPSFGGIGIGIAALGTFLLRQPLKLYFKDMRSRRQVPRTNVARQFLLFYATVTIAAALITLWLIPSLNPILPLLFALPPFGIQLAYDIGNKSRSLVAEVSGSLATGALASSIVMMQGWSLLPALGLWLAMAAKAVTAVLYVRSRLRMERAKPAGVMLTILAHGMACILLLLAHSRGLLPWTAPLAMSILMGRAVLGLSPWRTARPPKVIGIQELFCGLGFVLLLGIGDKLR